jgi:hypothetical protein
MIKKTIAAVLILGAALLVALYVHVRDNGIRLAPDAFIEKAGERDGIGSIFSLSYQGFRDGKVYLKSWNYKHVPETIIYWTELDGLPKDTKDQILNGTGRWNRESSKLRNH